MTDGAPSDHHFLRRIPAIRPSQAGETHGFSVNTAHVRFAGFHRVHACCRFRIARRVPGSAGPPVTVRWRGVETYEASFDAMRAFTDTRTADTGDEIWLVEHPPVSHAR